MRARQFAQRGDNFSRGDVEQNERVTLETPERVQLHLANPLARQGENGPDVLQGHAAAIGHVEGARVAGPRGQGVDPTRTARRLRRDMVSTPLMRTGPRSAWLRAVTTRDRPRPRGGLGLKDRQVK